MKKNYKFWMIVGSLGIAGAAIYLNRSPSIEVDEAAESNAEVVTKTEQSPAPVSSPREHSTKVLAPDSPERTGAPITDEMRQSQPARKDLVAGAGKQVTEGSRVTFEIVMKLMDGKVVFDSRRDGKPWKGVIGDGSIITGLDLMMRGMFVGGKRAIWLPPHLAYGKYGISPQVPPESKVYAEVDLISVF